jgi:hypothetical protein
MAICADATVFWTAGHSNQLVWLTTETRLPAGEDAIQHEPVGIVRTAYDRPATGHKEHAASWLGPPGWWKP